MHETGINQDHAKEMNRALVLRLLRKNGVCSRTTLGKLTGLNPATITNIVSDFQKVGIVKETGVISEGKGRNAIGLAIDPSKASVIGVRLARRYIIVGAFDFCGEEINDAWYSIDTWMKPKDVLEAMKEYIRKAIYEWTDGNVAAIGCAVPGPFLRKEGKIALMTEFPDWKDIQLQKVLEEGLGLPVFLEHDANTGALAYYWKYKADLKQTLVYMAVGQGVGAGIISQGNLFVGSLGLAGEIGHMSIDYRGRYCECGSRGCLETYCSSLAFVREVRNKIAEGNYSVLEKDCSFLKIGTAVREGDHLAVDEYCQACECLARGIINLINLLNPETIVIDDEMAAVSPELLKKSLEKIIKPAVLPQVWEELDIVIGAGTQEAVLQGAALLAIEEVMKMLTKE